MSLYGQLVRRVLYPLDRLRSGDGAELRYLREFERSQYWSEAELRDLQLQRMKAILAHAYANCPFYREQFDQAGVAPDDVRSLDDVRAIPVLEKRHIQERRDAMVATNSPKDDLLPNLTGGSTGTPLHFFVSPDRLRSRAAATWRHNRWAGWDWGVKVGSLWGAARDLPPATLKQRLRDLLLDRIVSLNTALITEGGLRQFHARLKRFRPKVLIGYANSLKLLAQYVKSHGGAGFQPKSIVSTAEVLEPEGRASIEGEFGCPVFNRYGCREVSVIASECAEHNGLHTMAEGLYVEVVCGGREARPGEVGAVLITDLLNFAMPLIRYRIGDVAALADGSCACGRGLPRLQGVQGRVTDFLVGGDGRLVSGAALTVVMVARRPRLGQVQIWQNAPGQVLFKIAARDGQKPPQEDLDYLDAQTRLYLGTDVTIDREFVDVLPSEPSGKFLFCRSKAACDFIDLHV